MNEAIAIVIAAIIAAGASLATLLVQLFHIVWQGRWIDKQFRLSGNLERQQELRQKIKHQLSEFYDPIYTLLSVNRDIYVRTGPKAVAKNEHPYVIEEKKEVWDGLVSNVIIPNNEKICDIIENRLHLLSESDSIELYLKFTTHARAYEIYRKQPFEGYLTNFSFPQGILEHVEEQRKRLYQLLQKQYEIVPNVNSN